MCHSVNVSVRFNIVSCMYIAGDVNQKVERLEDGQQSMESRTMLVEDKLHHLQGHYKN